MASTHVLFADEAGHAGINYLADQPFHLAAGVLIRRSEVPALEAVVRSTLLRPDNTEIKGKDLVKTPQGRRIATELLGKFGQARAMPFFVVMERRFAVAGKLVDVFLDPSHQDAIDWLPTSDVEGRQDAAEHLMDVLDPETLADFARAYREPSVDGYTATLETTIATLRSVGEDRLADAFAGALRSISGIVTAETAGDATTKHAQWASLNLPAFLHLVRRVDIVMDAYNGTYDVVHDEQPEFEPVFRRAIGMLSRPGMTGTDSRLPDGSVQRGMLRNLGSFCTASGENEVALLAPDILAASVVRTLRAATEPGADWTVELQELGRASAAALMMKDARGATPFAGIYSTTRTKLAVMSKLLMPVSATLR